MTNLHFVIQEHTTPSGVHWDLMLEHEGTLWTWRLEVRPEEIGKETVSAERIFDHAIRFLRYEGPVQNRTGQVEIADKGKLRWETLTSSHMQCQLDGRILKGLFCLTLQNEPIWELKREN